MAKGRGGLIDKLTVKSDLGRCFLAECFGTFFLHFFGCGSAAAVILSTPENGQVNVFRIAVGTGTALFFAILMSMKTSGGHVNPAVSLAMFTARKISLKKMLIYMVAQYIGGLIASFCVYGLYSDLILGNMQAAQILTIGGNATVAPPSAIATSAHIFASYPNPGASVVTCFFNELIGTLFLLFNIMFITDKFNVPIFEFMQAFFIGVTLFHLIIAYGLNCGSFNPARDLPGRILSVIVGVWGSRPFSINYYNFFWIPLVADHIGGIMGLWLYRLIFGFHLEGAAKEDTKAAHAINNSPDFEEEEEKMV